MTLKWILILLLASAGSAIAATFTVTTTNNAGPGSLRQAMNDANTNGSSDEIVFNIPGDGVHAISLATELPALLAPVSINGYTQPGSSPNTLANSNNAAIRIVVDGSSAGSLANGLILQSSNCTVRGLVISKFGGSGILVDSGSHSNVVAGNFIGTDHTGAITRGNTSNGIWVKYSDGNTIGGSQPADANILSGNDPYGIEIVGGSGNIIRGNFVGSSANGNSGLPNRSGGLLIYLGGFNEILGNVISSNASSGIQISSDDNIIQGNVIGLNARRTASLGNVNHGVMIDGLGNLVGGSTAGAGNWIAHNTRHGVVIAGSGSMGNSVLGNSIFTNGALGIDLNDDGVTTNDVNDADMGPNALQNYPALSSAHRGTSTTIRGTLSSAPATAYRLEFFANAAANRSEGQIFLGATTVTTGGGSIAPFTFLAATNLPLGTFLTATATDASGNTSELSPPIEVTEGSAFAIRLDGQIVTTNALTVTNSVEVEMESSLTSIFYTLDGEEPRLGPSYAGPFSLTQSAQLRAIAFGSDGAESIGAGPIGITVLHTPFIVEQPVSQTAMAGNTVVFGVEAGGSTPLAYQWRFNDSDIPGANDTSLTLMNVQPAMAGSYRVAASNAVGMTTSSVATLTVIVPPAILTHPASTNVILGASVSLCVTASGSGLRFQWRHNGVNIEDATNTCYHIPSVQLPDGGAYTVVVANDLQAVTSEPAFLRIQVSPLDAADHFTNRVLLMTNIVGGTNFTFTRESGERDHARKPGGKSAWYAWRPPTNGIARFLTAGSDFDTLLAVYTGDRVDALVEIASDEDSGGFFTSALQFNAEADVDYAIAIDGFAGAEGNFVLSWQFETNIAPSIVSGPLSQTVFEGSLANFSVTATGNGLAYQWYFNGTPLLTATSSKFTLTSVQATNVGYYHVRVSNSHGNFADSPVAVLEIGPQFEIQSQDKVEDLLANAPWPPPDDEEGDALVSLASPLASQSAGSGCCISVGLGGVGYQQVNIITNSWTSRHETNHCDRIANATRWLPLQPLTNGTLVVDTHGSAIPTVSGIYTQATGGALSELIQIACAIDPPGSPRTPMRVQARRGVVYIVVADGYEGAKGMIQLNWGLGRSPRAINVSTNYPAARPGQPIVLVPASGTTNGTPSPTFQWLLNGQIIPGATESRLRIESYSNDFAGDYHLVASNFAGTATSYVATLPWLLELDHRLFFGSYQVVVRGKPGMLYVFQTSSNLLQPNWSVLRTNRITDIDVFFEDPRISRDPQHFFRALGLYQ